MLHLEVKRDVAEAVLINEGIVVIVNCDGKSQISVLDAKYDNALIRLGYRLRLKCCKLGQPFAERLDKDGRVNALVLRGPVYGGRSMSDRLRIARWGTWSSQAPGLFGRKRLPGGWVGCQGCGPAADNTFHLAHVA